MIKKLHMHLLALFCLVSSVLFAQPMLIKDTSLKANSGLFPKIKSDALDKISIGGYYRFIGNYSEMKSQYAEFANGPSKRLFLGDDSQIPQLMLQISGKPSVKTSFGTDLFLWTPLTGSQLDYAKGLNLGVNLYGSHTTNNGTFSVKTGGIHWYALSPLTFGTNTGYNRFSIFERNPWDPNTPNVQHRYNKFYSDGALSQDVRWGQQAFHGMILDGVRLPHDLSFAFMYGKTQFNGGYFTTPNNSTGGKLRKDFGNQFISFNFFNGKTYTDSLAEQTVSTEIYTTEVDLTSDGFHLKGEFGMGKYASPSSLKNNWGEAINVKLSLPIKATRIPIELHYFQISPNVINNNGVFWNTSVLEYNQNVTGTGAAGSQTLLFPFASSVLQIGQMTNNRKGLEINSDFAVKKVKFSVGYSMNQEMSAVTNKVAFSHPANNLALSRFWRWGFPANVGPYGNLNKVYRGVYETIQITDSLSVKGFNSLEISAKLKTKLFQKELYFFYLGAFSSVQKGFSALPNYNNRAYLQTYYNQLEAYYHFSEKWVFTNYIGIDRIIANNATQLNTTTQRPKDQTGISFATGFDYYINKNTGLYIRQRWFTNSDKNFNLDRYKGMETTVELKIYF